MIFTAALALRSRGLVIGSREEKEEKEKEEKEEKEEEKKEEENIPLCGEDIGQRPLRGRCPKKEDFFRNFNKM